MNYFQRMRRNMCTLEKKSKSQNIFANPPFPLKADGPRVQLGMYHTRMSHGMSYNPFIYITPINTNYFINLFGCTRHYR